MTAPNSHSIPAPATLAADSNDAYTQLALSPVRPEERISALDSIRGFALLGILLMNIGAFGLPYAAYQSPLPAGGSTPNGRGGPSAPVREGRGSTAGGCSQATALSNTDAV